MTRSRILVVDDDPTNLKLLDEALGDEYELACADDGEVALKMVESFDPHLILLDVMMPVMNGYETCARLRGDPRYQDLPILMLSARASQRDAQRGLASGADRYVGKPCDVDELVELIRGYLASESDADADTRSDLETS